MVWQGRKFSSEGGRHWVVEVWQGVWLIGQFFGDCSIHQWNVQCHNSTMVLVEHADIGGHQALSRHEKYYFSDGSVILCVCPFIQPSPWCYPTESVMLLTEFFFQCDNILYNLHRSFLSQKSEFLAGLFDVPQPQDQAIEGSNDNNPIHFAVPSKEFNYLLQYLYDLYVCRFSFELAWVGWHGLATVMKKLNLHWTIFLLS